MGEVRDVSKLARNKTPALVDVDTREIGDEYAVPKVFAKLRAMRLRCHGLCYIRSRRGWHLLADLVEKLSPVELMAAQAILGDDRWRSALNFQRVRGMMEQGGVSDFWRDRWNLLFAWKPPD